MYGSLTNSLWYVASHAIASMAVAVVGDLFGLEIVLLLAVYWAARTRANFGENFFQKIEAFGSRLAQRKIVAPVALAAAVIVFRLAMVPAHPIPHPVIVDEFSQLLLADTLAHGRLANPPHALWHSFETIHEIQQPTYSSMYFPGPALLLWAGQILTGVPWFGVLVATGALCGIVYWALLAWFPSRWAFLGGSLVALHIGLVSYWMDSYWGGTFASIGGTLLLGAFGRLEKMRSFGARSAGLAVLMALGIGMLANSRPYEGMALCVPVAVRMCGWLLESRNLFAPKFFRVVAPLAVSLALIGAGMGVYFQAVTGSPTRLPYVVNQERYGWPMTLPWMEVKYVHQDRPEFADYYLYEIKDHVHYASLTQFLAWETVRLQSDWRFYIGPALMIPCLFLRRICGSRRLRFVLVCGGVVLLACYITPHFPHYMAPLLLPMTAVLVQGFRHLRQAARGNEIGNRLGLRLSRAIPVVLLAVVSASVMVGALHLPDQKYAGFTSWCCTNRGHVDQQAVVRRLPAGRHLLLVRYRSDHDGVEQWVYNGADIDGSPVVWARELGGTQDRKLLDYFKDRQAWIVEADLHPPRLTPYRPSEESGLSTKAAAAPMQKLSGATSE